MKYLEENYISAVIVLDDIDKDKISKLKGILNVLKSNFKNYEMVVVKNRTLSKINILNELDEKVTIIELPRRHNIQQALTAGIDITIGDYIIEIPSINTSVDYNLIIDMYNECQQGYDFVFCTPKKTSISSKLFYNILNKYFESTFSSDINTSIMTLSSRRGQNKTASLGNTIVNRNVSYVLSGLVYSSITSDISYNNKRDFGQNVSLMLDTFIYYTNIITKCSIGIAVAFLIISILTGFYAVLAYYVTTTIAGWASLVVIMSIGFSGLFMMLAIFSKYLHHILNSSLGTKNYIFRSLDK